MKKSQFLAAAMLLSLASCTTSDDIFTGSEELAQQQAQENTVQFGTFLNQSQQTRAGQTGNMALGDLQTSGFGVFAYHTPEVTTGKYTYWNTATSATDPADPGTNTTAGKANFMFNQKVTWNDGSSNVSKWEYTPIKYWPNEIGNDETAGVDDQENDQDKNPAYGNEHNGNVSFFAYAPYVDFGTDATSGIGNNSTDPKGTTFGITAINGQATLDAANAEVGDPVLTYTVSQKYPVDLLWGTKGNTSPNVNGDEPTSYYTKQKDAGVPSLYPVNVNLNKQRTNGVIDFAFKHALASLGGGSDVSSSVGFQVKLDVDDMKGAESGGLREKFIASGSTPDAWRTIVTIKKIEVSNDLDDNNSIDGDEMGLAQKGKLNLATGEWSWDSADEGLVEQIIGDPSVTYDAKLNEKIAENYDASNTWIAHLTDATDGIKPYFKDDNALDDTKDHPGVTENAQNVYNASTQNPILFIPGQKPVLRVTVDYIVRTYDANLSDKCTMVEQVISKKITFPTAFEMNKHYNLIMHLGLTGVKFTASVDSWDEGYIADNDGDLTLESSDIYLPRNVGGLMLTFSDGPKNAASKLTADVEVAVISAAKYYIDNTEKTATVADLSYKYAENGATNYTDSKPTWLEDIADGKVKIGSSKSNTTFTDRSVSIIAYSEKVASTPFSITQYGCTATQVKGSWSSVPTILTTEQENTATATSVDLGSGITIEAKGFETDANGKATSTKVDFTTLTDTYEFVFIDDATGQIAGWITMSGKSIALAANATSKKRTATMYVKLNGKLVPFIGGESGSETTITVKQKDV